jgi:hypothetical protein
LAIAMTSPIKFDRFVAIGIYHSFSVSQTIKNPEREVPAIENVPRGTLKG